MTEQEAKTKWCPFARVAGVRGSEAQGCSWNRYPGEGLKADHPALCLGPGCMAWRRTGTAKVENHRGQLVDRDIDGTGRWHYDGYCGLAGKPER